MTLLSVNVNKIATLRNSRGQDNPNLLETIKNIISYGAQGITIHPRPDQRHITQNDVYEISELLKSYKNIEFNIEGYPSENFLNMIKKVKPHQCTLVPDPPEILTSNAGWKFAKNCVFLTKTISNLRNINVRSSLFLDPSTFDDIEEEALKIINPDRIELYTESYAKNYLKAEHNISLQIYQNVAQRIKNINININAGHDLNQKNLKLFKNSMVELKEVSIGHALICDALYDGLEKTIKNYKIQLL